MNKKLLYAVLVLAVLAILGYFLIPSRTPQTLVAAIRSHPEAFPGAYRVVLPLSAATRLGYGERATPANLPAADYVTTADAPCFFISPKQDSSLSELNVAYGDSRTVSANAEAEAAAASGGLSLRKEDSATLKLIDLRVESGVGWPNLNGPCKFGDTTKVHDIVTSQVVARNVSLSMSRTSTSEGSASAGASAGAPASAKTKAGWNTTTDRSASGQDIVLSVAFTPVTVEVTTADRDLGTTPEIGKVWPLPAGFDATLVIDSFDAAAKTLRFETSLPVDKTQQAPPELKVCASGTAIDLAAGRRCDFWLPPGTALVSVQWGVETRDGAPHLILKTRGYRTSFAAAPAPVPTQH
jgi:hypothetical protein